MAHEPKTAGQTSSDHEVLQLAIGVRVRKAREHAKLKQSELGVLIGSGQSHVFLIEQGSVNVTLKTLVKLANALNINPIDLLIDSKTNLELADPVLIELASLLQSAREDLSLAGERLQRAEMLLAGKNKDTKPSAPSDG